MIHCAPEIVGLSIDLYEHLVEMPLPVRKASKRLDPLPLDVGSKHRSKPVSPISDGFVRNVDPALV